MVKSAILRGIGILRNPEKEFSDLHSQQFEEVVYYYLKMLLFISIVAASLNLLWEFVKIAYLQVFRNLSVNYLPYLNFIAGQSLGIGMGYLIIGTLVMFFLSLLLGAFVRIKYTELLKRMFYSLTPVLLFGWFPKLALSFLIYSCFLFYIGSKHHKIKKVSKKSIDQRV